MYVDGMDAIVRLVIVNLAFEIRTNATRGAREEKEKKKGKGKETQTDRR